MNSITWWIWSLAVAISAIRSDQFLIPVMSILVFIYVVTKRGTNTVWGNSFKFSIQLAISALIIRFIFAVLIGTQLPGEVLFTLPQIQMPDFLVGIRIGGAVTEARLLSVLDESLTFALIVIAFGAATSLSSPIALIKMISSRIYLFGVTLIIAFSVLPQIVASYQRVKMARKFRGEAKINLRNFYKILTPVLEESLEKAIDLSAAMESRGFGYSKRPTRYRAEAFNFADLLITSISIYLLLFLPTLLSSLTLFFALLIFIAFASAPLWITKPLQVAR
jgi:energy-coupling factor transporter transmembrane protein EcfT